MNQETLDNVIWRMDEVRGLLEMQGKAAALPRLERHIQDLRELATPPPRRPLSSLSDDEAREVYRLAFPNRQYDYTEYDADDVTVLRGKNGTDLWLYDDGDVLVQNGAYSREFRAVAVVRYLDKLGIQLG